MDILILIKPDAVERRLVGEIIKRFEQVGFKIKEIKTVKFTREKAYEFYPKDEEWLKNVGRKAINSLKEKGKDPKEIFGTDDEKEVGLKIREWLVDYLTSGICIAILFEGDLKVARKLIGSTDPSKSPPGTIRGDLSSDSIFKALLERRTVRNLIHCPDNEKENEEEIKKILCE